jgi:predicted MFS family arabinose efflux permease
VLAALSILLLSLLSIPVPAAAAAGQGGRPLAVIARQPAFIAAVTNNVLGYASMVFVMSATPLAAVACGHTSDDAIGIIRMHLIGMFAPSFVTGSLIARFGVTRILLAGAGLLLASALAALSGLTLYNFWAALALLGVGWNFLYVGGTTLLTSAYRPEERAKTQAANEFITFGLVACASFASGGVMARLGWAAISYATIAPMLLAAAATLWYAAISSRRAAPLTVPPTP